MAKHSSPLTRKDIAALLGFNTSDQVKRNEKALNLDKCRCELNSRVVLYNYERTIATLQRRGLI